MDRTGQLPIPPSGISRSPEYINAKEWTLRRNRPDAGNRFVWNTSGSMFQKVVFRPNTSKETDRRSNRGDHTPSSLPARVLRNRRHHLLPVYGMSAKTSRLCSIERTLAVCIVPVTQSVEHIQTSPAPRTTPPIRSMLGEFQHSADIRDLKPLFSTPIPPLLPQHRLPLHNPLPPPSSPSPLTPYTASPPSQAPNPHSPPPY